MMQSYWTAEMKPCDSSLRRLHLRAFDLLIMIKAMQNNDAKGLLYRYTTMGLFSHGSPCVISWTPRRLSHVPPSTVLSCGYSGEHWVAGLIVVNILWNFHGAFLLLITTFFSKCWGAMCHFTPWLQVSTYLILSQWEQSLMVDWHAHSLARRI